ncbi:flagellar hook protein FlgE [Sphingomonas morindae]|uniref:Flagellar hook protein FlgE n=1 Tax=Sphingomonas morindae TaxID=1541170 RepID=A0ABY4X599_9SPHN|nr:flagellar hook protein FlgE [Sphingomonas morindae]USI72015.1 flagellar hook protein FlgE [Sphingomonas morindae]
MSLYSALNAGVSGLGAQSGAMATVADNIVNVNTVGFKGSKADFATMVTGGNSRSSYSAGGVSLVTKAAISRAGTLNAGSRTTDLGIEGKGFFIVRPQPDSKDVAYTRAGNFFADQLGNLVNAAGYYLQGWPLDADGNAAGSGLESLRTVNLNGLLGSADPTRRLTMQLNLDSRLDPYAGTPAYSAGAMAQGTVKPQYSQSKLVYDAQGNPHDVTFGFIKTGPNTWQAEIYGKAGEVDASQANGLLASGKLVFDGDGKLDPTASDRAVLDGFTPKWANGAGSVKITMPFGGTDNVWKQIADVSKIGAYSVDGGKLSEITKVQVSQKGIVTVFFEGGSARDIFKVPLAAFQNADGLTRLNGNAYQDAIESGSPSIEPAGEGAGKIWGGQLEASTTDLAEEFSNMIRFQRAYSASSKIITTVDEMLQELSALKR